MNNTMKNMINEELLEMVTGGVIAVPSVQDAPKTKKGEETASVDYNNPSWATSGGACGGW